MSRTRRGRQPSVIMSGLQPNGKWVTVMFDENDHQIPELQWPEWEIIATDNTIEMHQKPKPTAQKEETATR